MALVFIALTTVPTVYNETIKAGISAVGVNESCTCCFLFIRADSLLMCMFCHFILQHLGLFPIKT